MQDLEGQQPGHAEMPGGYMGELGCPAGPMGPLMDALPADTLSVVMSLLQPRDLASLGMTCRGLRAVVEEGSVWQAVLRKEFPGAQLTASTAADWKHAYLMQVLLIFPCTPKHQMLHGLDIAHSAHLH